MTDWRAVPKVELHLHLEGAAPPAFIRRLAHEQGRDLGTIFEGEAYRWRDFTEFLETYEAVCSCLTTPDTYRRLIEAVLAEQAAHGVVYTEHFLAPQLTGGGDPSEWSEYLAAMEAGADAAEAAHGIVCRFIPVAVRHLGPEAATATARLVTRTRSPRVTGWGLAGEERRFEPADFAPAFGIAAEAGLGLTAHAGELCGAEMVRATLDALPVTRIGHGVRAIEDAALVARIAAEGITLETCPGSNIALKLFPDWDRHPVTRLRDAGVKVTLSTDDPPYFATDMSHEYAMLARHQSWTAEDFAWANRIALAAAFCEAPLKVRLARHFEASTS